MLLVVVTTFDATAGCNVTLPAAIFLVDWLGYLGACLASPMAWIGGLIPLMIAFVVTARRLVK